MPINFELTFTQPLLAQLDTGQVKGSKDMAKFITDNYVRTMLAGIPGGGSVPPVLPAPGLSTPAGPPPFPIPSIPINNFKSRQRAMQRVLQTYFEAREVLILQDNIKSIIKAIFLAIQKVKVARTQINALLAQAATIQKELLALPQLVEQIKNAITEIIQREKQKLESLYSRFDRFKLTLSTQEFENRFGSEIELVNALKNFKITLNIADYQVLADLISTLEFRLSTLPEGQDGSEEAALKSFIANQARASLSVITNAVNAVLRPDDFINYFKDLASIDVKLAPVLDIMYRYRFIKKKLEPQIIKLKRKLQDLVRKFETKIKAKVQELKNKLKDWLKKLATRKAGSGKKELYKSAAKIISDFKKKYLKKIKKIRTTIRDVQTIVKLTQALIVRTTRFKKGLDEIASRSLEEYVDQFLKGAKDSATVPALNASQLQRDLNIIYNRLGITNQIVQNIINKQLVGKITTPTTLLRYLESSPEPIVNLYREFLAIIKDALNLEEKVRNLFNGKPLSYQPKEKSQSENEKITVLDLLTIPLKEFEKFVNKIDKKIRAFIKKQTDKLQATVTTIAEGVKNRLIMLIPLKSDLKDGKTKAEILQAKKDKLKTTKNRVKKAIKITNIVVGKIFPGASALAQNLANTELRYAKNQGPLTKIIDGIYDIKKLNADKSAQRSLEASKRKLNNDIRDYYYGLELLIDIATKVYNEVSASNFIQNFGEKLYRNTAGELAQGYIDLYEKIKTINKLKSGKFKDFIEFFTDTYAFRALNKTYVRSTLLAMEKKYMSETITFVNSITENPLVSRLFPGLKPGMDSIIVFLIDRMRYCITKIKELLNKLYSKTVKPIFDKINEKRKKIEDDIKAWIKTHVVKRALNLDLKLMSLAYNIATRVFWTGFSWSTPNGVRYTCVSIGPFIPLMTKVDAGASALVRELARNLNTQLTLMVGLVSPPPPTGIPPFPFSGYR